MHCPDDLLCKVVDVFWTNEGTTGVVENTGCFIGSAVIWNGLWYHALLSSIMWPEREFINGWMVFGWNKFLFYWKNISSLLTVFHHCFSLKSLCFCLSLVPLHLLKHNTTKQFQGLIRKPVFDEFCYTPLLRWGTRQCLMRIRLNFGFVW